MPTQRCPRLRHALLHRLPTPDRLVRDHVPDPRLGIEQNPLQDLLNHRPRSPLAPVPRSKAILAISLIAASVNIKSAPWNRTSFLNC